MDMSLRSLFLSLLATLGIGAGSGIFVVLANGLISGPFHSAHYHTVAQSHRFIFGVVLAYGLLFAAVSIFQIFANFGTSLVIFYPLSGLVALLAATYLRTLGGALGTLDCSTHCVDTIAPQTAEQTATKLVVRVLIAIYVLCVITYLTKGLAKRQSALQPR